MLPNVINLKQIKYFIRRLVLFKFCIALVFKFKVRIYENKK